MGEPISTTAMIGLAVAAAGTAVKTVEANKRRNEVENVISRTRQMTEKQRREAMNAWNKGLSNLTPEEQQKRIDEETARRNAAYSAAAADVPRELNIVKASSDAPKIVQSEAAKQLGNELDKARAQIRGQAKLAGWDQNRFLQQLMLGRTAENINQSADFIRGGQNAAQMDINMINNAPMSPLGDILSAGGSAMMSVPSSPQAMSLPGMTAQDQQMLNWYNQIG